MKRTCGNCRYDLEGEKICIQDLKRKDHYDKDCDGFAIRCGRTFMATPKVKVIFTPHNYKHEEGIL